MRSVISDEGAAEVACYIVADATPPPSSPNKG